MTSELMEVLACVGSKVKIMNAELYLAENAYLIPEM